MGAANALPSPGDDEAEVYVLRNGRYVPQQRMPRGFHRVQFFQDAPQLEKAETQSFPVRLRKNSLKLVDGRLDATISATEPCTVVVRELVPLDRVEELADPDPSAVPLPSGCAQHWRSPPLASALSDLAVVDSFAPLVVELRTESHAELTIVRLSIAGRQPTVLKQRVFVDGVGYDLQDIYGREEADECSERHCVICLLEPKDTAVLPCRHLCLCGGCAEVMRMQSRKCPICRQGIVSLLQIDAGEVDEPASPQ